MTTHPPFRNRRDVLAGMAMAGAAGLFRPARSVAQSAAGVDASHDWAWLAGSWDVAHHRLKERLAGNHEWQDFGRAAGRASACVSNDWPVWHYGRQTRRNRFRLVRPRPPPASLVPLPVPGSYVGGSGGGALLRRQHS
jgi:hypothetical protein